MTIPSNYKLAVKLIKLTSSDGFWRMRDDKAFVGKLYYVDPATKRVQKYFNQPTQTDFEAEVVDCWDENNKCDSYLPTELLDI